MATIEDLESYSNLYKKYVILVIAMFFVIGFTMLTFGLFSKNPQELFYSVASFASVGAFVGFILIKIESLFIINNLRTPETDISIFDFFFSTLTDITKYKYFVKDAQNSDIMMQLFLTKNSVLIAIIFMWSVGGHGASFLGYGILYLLDYLVISALLGFIIAIFTPAYDDILAVQDLEISKSMILAKKIIFEKRYNRIALTEQSLSALTEQSLSALTEQKPKLKKRKVKNERTRTGTDARAEWTRYTKKFKSLDVD